ncbi:MAG: hypothetical protein GC190_04745 [Alphaproteobacteria bacterium]|nr:hypothetical protein [Alphaproteobacteria bacterium]
MRDRPHGLCNIVVVSAVAAVALSACASTRISRHETGSGHVSFDPRAVAWSTKIGGNAIVGTADLTTSNGESRTCAGLEVRLVPDAPYTRDRIAMLYGTTTEGFVDASQARHVQQRADAAVDPAYARSHKVTMCDGQGRFEFSKLANGTYYVLAPVVWRKPGAATTDGGFLMQRVTLSGGETKRLHMTPATRVSSR